MNPDLQQQTDLLIHSIDHLNDSLHRDAIALLIVSGFILLALCILGYHRR